MRFPRVENFFNEEDEFEDVVCCDSELSPSIMDTIIENTLMLEEGNFLTFWF